MNAAPEGATLIFGMWAGHASLAVGAVVGCVYAMWLSAKSKRRHAAEHRRAERARLRAEAKERREAAIAVATGRSAA